LQSSKNQIVCVCVCVCARACTCKHTITYFAGRFEWM